MLTFAFMCPVHVCVCVWVCVPCRVHFLDGIYTYDDLRKQVNKTVPTIFKTEWKITVKNGVSNDIFL